MKITWFGNTFFEINSKKNRNEEISLFINPNLSEKRVKSLKKLPDIVLFSNQEIAKKYGFFGKETFIVKEPGEYEKKEIYFKGIFSDFSDKKSKENIIYKIIFERINICHLGDFNQKDFSQEQLENIGSVDILMIPIKDFSRKSMNIISQIEPRLVIPMKYENLKEVKNFLKIAGEKTENLQFFHKILIKEKDLPKEGQKIILMKEK